MTLEWIVEKSPLDDLYYIRCYNESGGRELSTWYGYRWKKHTIREFQKVFPYDVFDPTTKETFGADGQ